MYALTVSLALNGVAAMDDGDQFVLLVPLEAVPRVKLGAPKRQPVAPLIDPGKLPSFPDPGSVSPRISDLPRPAATGNSTAEPAGKPELSTSPGQVDQLVAFYAELTGRKAVASDLYGDKRIAFNIKAPLTVSEVQYAIETTLALNNLAIIPAVGGSIRAGHLTEVRKSSQTSSETSRKP